MNASTDPAAFSTVSPTANITGSSRSNVPETTFLVVALVCIFSFVLICGIPMLFFRRAVVAQSADNRAKRDVVRRAANAHQAQRVWSALDEAKDREMAEAAMLSLKGAIDSGVPRDHAEGKVNVEASDDDDQDVGYAEFSHAMDTLEGPVLLVDPQDRPLVAEALEYADSKRRSREPKHIPLTSTVRTAVGQIESAIKYAAVNRGPPSSPKTLGKKERRKPSYMPPSELPWIAARQNGDVLEELVPESASQPHSYSTSYSHLGMQRERDASNQSKITVMNASPSRRFIFVDSDPSL
jgi:hypothetical protein